MSDAELLGKSKTEPVRRLEVFTGAGRRRSWTAAQKAQIVAESHAEGATVCEVARRHALTPQQLFAWRRNAARPDERKTYRGAMAFAPVVVAAPPHRSNRATTPAIEVVVGMLTVRVPVGADLATLQLVLHAVRAAS
jgi:transposase